MKETDSVCPGCGLQLKSGSDGLDARYNASGACLQLYWELSAFTLSLLDRDFIHQPVVDAYAAQHSGSKMKPIGTAFALIGLYLTFERGYSGREVQKAHMQLGNLHRQWPRFEPPAGKAKLTVLDALGKVTKESYQSPISDWGRSVWDLWSKEHQSVGELVLQAGINQSQQLRTQRRNTH